MTSTTVVNRTKEDYDVYIGRGSDFGNPYRIGPDGTREEVIVKYRDYFYQRIVYDEMFKKAVLNLRGKRLGCFCKPKDCHGDIIVEYLNEYYRRISEANKRARSLR